MSARARLRDELGLSYIYISHDLATVRFLSQKLLIIRQGRMMEAGLTRAIYQNPVNPYTRLLLDSARDIIIDQDPQQVEQSLDCNRDYPQPRIVEEGHVVYFQ